MSDNGQALTPRAGAMVRQEFGAQSMAVQAETASAAVAAQATAAVQARYVVALQRPRDWDNVRVRLLKHCERYSFADASIYHKPIGKGIEGLSIRFAETALREMGNVFVNPMVVRDDETIRIVHVSVTDLESNSTFDQEVVIEKTVERHKLGEDQVPLWKRVNAQGKPVYIVKGTDDEISNKQNAQISKAIRNQGLRLLPADIVDECRQRCEDTLEKGTAQDPDAARKTLADSFAKLNVLPSDLKAYLGHDLGQATPAELAKLRKVYRALADGESSWIAILEAQGKATEAPRQEAPKGASTAEKIKAKVAPKKEVQVTIEEAKDPISDIGDLPPWGGGREPGSEG